MDKQSVSEAARRFIFAANRYATVPEIKRYVRARIRSRPALRDKEEGLLLLERAILEHSQYPWADFFQFLLYPRLRRWCRGVLGHSVKTKPLAVEALHLYYNELASRPSAPPGAEPKRETHHAPPPPPPPPREKARRQRARRPSPPPPPREPAEAAKLRDRIRKIDALIADAAATAGEKIAARQAREVMQRKLAELLNPHQSAANDVVLAPCMSCRATNRIRVDKIHQQPRCGRCHAELFRPAAGAR